MSDELKGKAENLKGRVKQAAGSLTGDKKLEAEGAVERVKGAAEEKVGEAKRKVKEAEEESRPTDRRRRGRSVGCSHARKAKTLQKARRGQAAGEVPQHPGRRIRGGGDPPRARGQTRGPIDEAGDSHRAVQGPAGRA